MPTGSLDALTGGKYMGNGRNKKRLRRRLRK